MKRALGTLAALGAVGLTAIAATPGGAKPPARLAPVIGKPAAAPGRAYSARRFAVAFRVTRSDTGAALTDGTAAFATSVAGNAVAHTSSYRNGLAKVGLLVPPNAMGKQLRVKLVIRSHGRTATRVATFAVLRGQPLASLSVGDASATEGSTGTTALSFTVTLSAADLQPVSVTYATADGTAAAPGDYAAASGTLTFEPGATTKTVTVQVAGDAAIEADEAFRLTLSDPVTATIADGSATGTIANDDVPPTDGVYAGSTAQGRSIVFEARDGVTRVSNFVASVDMDCLGSPRLSNFRVDLTNVRFVIGAGWAFDYSVQKNNTSGFGYKRYHVTGTLDTAGRASGTVSAEYYINAPDGYYNCKSGAVGWGASRLP